jgi:hypothetical protein
MFVHAPDADAVFGGFVFQHLAESIERPPVQIELAVVAPISTVTDTTQVAHSNRPSIPGGTFGHHILRGSVEEVVAALAAFPVQPSRLRESLSSHVARSFWK